MGAGYFPLIFSAVTIVAGVLVAVAALFRSGALVVPPWRPFAAVCASIAVFIVSLSQAGLVPAVVFAVWVDRKSTRSELQSLMRISYAVFCLKKQNHRPVMHTSKLQCLIHRPYRIC